MTTATTLFRASPLSRWSGSSSSEQAWLAAANALSYAGVDGIVLEARERIGGRLHTVAVGGVPIDLGGSRIHTPIGNPMRRYADQAGVGCRNGTILGAISGYDRSEQRPLLDDELAGVMEIGFERFPAMLDELRAELGPTASAADAVDRFLPVATLGDGQSRRARDSLRTYISAAAADLPENESLQWMWTEDEYEGDPFGDLPVGGYVRLIEAMADGLAIRSNAAVATIDVSAKGVRVTGADGAVEEGPHVLCTLPLGVLKSGSVRFSPGFPDARRVAIDRLGFGHFEKIAVTFDEPFWRPTWPGHLLIFPEVRDAPLSVIFNQDAFGAGPALVALVYHADAHRVVGQTAESAVRWLLARLGDALGRPFPEPTSIATSSWAKDPRTLGAYTHYPPGACPDDVDELARPLLGRLLFAGEATSRSSMGYADGALQSGIREAKRLLRQPGVMLTSPAVR